MNGVVFGSRRKPWWCGGPGGPLEERHATAGHGLHCLWSRDPGFPFAETQLHGVDQLHEHGRGGGESCRTRSCCGCSTCDRPGAAGARGFAESTTANGTRGGGESCCCPSFGAVRSFGEAWSPQAFCRPGCGGSCSGGSSGGRTCAPTPSNPSCLGALQILPAATSPETARTT